MASPPRQRRTWPYAVAGALLAFGLTVAIYAGAEEASNPIFYLGSFALVVGALVGALVGGLINDKRAGREAGAGGGSPLERSRD